MPKRTLQDTAVMPAREGVPPAKAQKTERSHEENQERAYIAASRRADRSLEARVQSARMASEIHRRRTGRGLKVTEEIVIKEEMYEEEEDDLPRQYKYLTAHLQTNSPAMNHRVNAYITTQAAMATMARYNEVNRLFSESFPSAMAYQQQLNQSMFMTPLMNNGNAQYSPTTPAAPSPTDSQFATAERRRSSAISAANANVVSSPPPLSPASVTTTTPESRCTPYQTPASTFRQLDPQLQQLQAPQPPTSSFTSQLPNEVKLMANIDMNDPMAPFFFGGNPSSLQMFGQHPDMGNTEHFQKSTPVFDACGQPSSPHDSIEQNDERIFSPVDTFGGHFDPFSRMGTPGGGLTEGTWDSFVDFGSEQ
ncbi:hypothetical protein BJ170DRAFT_392922 [Xylariales sp. AK1849]|nr:hypothetical protein BJ170DRAFT_392922 [Xylariales sp. AK1849]